MSNRQQITSKDFSLEAFVRALAAPELGGRIPGTRGHELAKQLIIETFEQFGLQKVQPDSWEQPYVTGDGVRCANLLALKPGKQGTKEWVLLGAHYDHCFGEDGHVDLGANDNAASVGAVFEAVKQLQDVHHDCHVLLAIFDTEEPPYYGNGSPDMGSEQFYAHLPVGFDIDHLKAAVILDLIGHDIMVEQREEAVLAIGVDSAKGLSAAVKAAGERSGLDVYRFGKGVPFSDHMVFERHDKPHVFLSSGMAFHYHSRFDTPEILNFAKMAKVAAFLKQLVVEWNVSDDEQTAADIDPMEPASELIRFFEPALDKDRTFIERNLQTAPEFVNGALFKINGILRVTRNKITLTELLKAMLR